jgi:two-component system response regulator PilR (NtrC family)
VLGALGFSLATIDSFHRNDVGIATQQNSFFLFALAIIAALGCTGWRAVRLTRAAFWSGVSVDGAIVSLLVYVTGGPLSPFLAAYLGLPCLGAIYQGRAAGLLIAGGCAVAYGALVVGLDQGLVTLADGGGLVHPPPGGLLLHLVGLASAMVLVAVGTFFVTRRLSASTSLAAASVALAEEQRALLREIPDGILKLSADGTIEYFNAAAARLLEAPPEALTGKAIDRHLRAVGATPGITCAPTTSLRTGEFDVRPGDGSPSRHLHFTLRPVFDKRHELAGGFLILRDVTTLRSAQEQLEIQERMARLLAGEGEDRLRKHYTRIKGFVGESAVMQRVFTLIERVARVDATVLISGESGTGKELVARAIHLGSERSDGPFVPVNCGAIPENLIESELFGHRKGAFTGADHDAIGLFRRADGGTIFLDEIGELPLSLQAKLLRVLQDKRVRPVGGETDIPIQLRVVAATNRNLRNEVKAGRFREDLYYRLNVVNVALPPLRERREDIPPLVNSLLRTFATGGAPLPVVPPATMQHLMAYDYPGNVRELENILERALVFGGEVLLPEHLPDFVRDRSASEAEQSQSAPRYPETTIIETDQAIEFPLNLDLILAETERRYLELALVRTNGAKKKAADLLGLNFRSFRYRLQKFNIAADRGDDE